METLKISEEILLKILTEVPPLLQALTKKLSASSYDEGYRAGLQAARDHTKPSDGGVWDKDGNGGNGNTTQPVKPTVTLDTLRDLFSRASKAGHKDSLRATLELQGAKVLPDLKPDSYEKIAEYVQGLLNAKSA